MSGQCLVTLVIRTSPSVQFATLRQAVLIRLLNFSSPRSAAVAKQLSCWFPVTWRLVIITSCRLVCSCFGFSDLLCTCTCYKRKLTRRYTCTLKYGVHVHIKLCWFLTSVWSFSNLLLRLMFTRKSTGVCSFLSHCCSDFQESKKGASLIVDLCLYDLLSLKSHLRMLRARVHLHP